MAVYAIGDVQGCYDELCRLLDTLRFDPAVDRLWFTGDLVNRGPGSLATLRRVRALGAAAVTVLGNHDLHLLALARGHGRGLRAGDTLADVLAASDRDELLAWLSSCPLLHEDAALGWLMVHAGLPPEWDVATARRLAREVEAALAHHPDALYAAMYGDEPDLWSESLAGSGRLRYAVNCFTRLRYCSPHGRLLLRHKGPPEQAPVDVVPWFSVAGRRSAGTRIVFGHWSALGFRATDGVVGLDTGCVWGGTLTALRLDVPDAQPVQVPCAVSRSWTGLE